MGLPSRWVRHLDPSNTEALHNYESAIRNSTTLREALLRMLGEELTRLDNSEMSDAQFEQPNWEYKQAFKNGQRSKIKYLMDLLEFK